MPATGNVRWAVLTDEFAPITEIAIRDVLRERFGYDDAYADPRRRRPRWPFPGTVELWIATSDEPEQYMLARALNLSTAGIGVLVDENLEIGQEIRIAIHQPEATLFGQAVVRHSEPTPHGTHVGLEFLY